MAYDKQTRRVYRWEDKFLEWVCHDPSFTKAQTAKNVAWACRKYGIPRPAVRHIKLQGYPFYDPEAHAITFSEHFHNLQVVIHESAHAITDWLLGADGEMHSPEFMGILIWLLAERGIAPRSALLASLKETGVRAVHPSRVSPKSLRAHYRRQILWAEEDREEWS